MGGAVVFSCGALHQVTPVTRGRRYAFLAFLYGEADAALREANNAKLHAGAAQYKVESDRLLVEPSPAQPSAREGHRLIAGSHAAAAAADQPLTADR